MCIRDSPSRDTSDARSVPSAFLQPTKVASAASAATAELSSFSSKAKTDLSSSDRTPHLSEISVSSPSLKNKHPGSLSELSKVMRQPSTPPPDVLQRLECVVLNGCKTEEIGGYLLDVADKIAVVCWSTLAEDNAARAFSVGFYACVDRMLKQERRRSRDFCRGWRARGRGAMVIEDAFKAGCESF
eukprot:5500210-Prymnesium_polylepis.1